MFGKKKEEQGEFETISERRLSGKLFLTVTVWAVIISIMHVWMNSASLMIALKKNALHLGLMLSLAFLLYPASRKSPRSKPSKLDWILAALGLSIGLYIYFFYDKVVDNSLILDGIDYFFAVLAVLLTLEGGRRTVGNLLPILAIVFILYARFGYLLSGMLSHKGFSWARILTRMYFTDEGILGDTLMVSATYVFMFILFGSFLNKTGTAAFFNDFAMAFAGRLRGGPAQVSVMASAMMGTISGSAQANVATTGAFTIPLMKKVGYKAEFAGAVEATASTGGILMPPIMGAAAFMMSSYLGIPYLKIMYAGIIPALFYYFAVFVMVDLEARKTNLVGLSREELPNLWKTITNGGHLVLPILVILFMLVKGYTPLYSAFFAIGACIAGSMIRAHTRLDLKKVIEALDEGARTAISVATSCAVVGFVAGVVTMTGLGQVIAHNIMVLSGNQLWLALFLVMIASMVLGMGLPSVACYIITATIAAPALIKMGVIPLAAHFFAFYYGTLSGVIPPVALTSYTAAGLAIANPNRVAFTGLKLAFAGLIIPYLFVYSPILLMENVVVGKLILALISGIIGIICLGIAGENYLFSSLRFYERLFFFGASIMLIKPGLNTDLIGLSILIGGLSLHWFRYQRNKRLSSKISV